MKNVKNLLLAAALLLSMGAQAQSERKMRYFELELGAGTVLGTSDMKIGDYFTDNKAGYSYFLEGRYNFDRLPLDLGLHLGVSSFNRSIDDLDYFIDNFKGDDINFLSYDIMAVADFNLRRTKAVSLFVGIGAGYSALNNDHFDVDTYGEFKDGIKGSFIFMPRVGVELFHHIRVTADYKLVEKSNRNFGISLGVVFGGGVKRK